MENKQPFVLDFDSDKIKPKLLLHSCCAPCSSSVIEMLAKYFEITVLYYNPNIFPGKEYDKRIEEQKLFCERFIPDKKIQFVGCDWRSEDFEAVSKGFENEKELGKRCTLCYRMRLEEAARYASEHGYDYFTTTLSVSPLKDAARLNKIGEELQKTYGVKYLVSDFKKKNGYKRSCDISKEFNMYRQYFCGCKYSLAERLMQAKGFIFDADGTLFDTMGFYVNFGAELVRFMGGEPDPGLREEIRSKTVQAACEFVKEKYCMAQTAEEIYAKSVEMMQKLYGEDCDLKKGVYEFMTEAKKRGIKMCIATASPKEEIMLAAKRLGIDSMVDFVLTCPELGVTKNTPDIYDEAAKRMGIEKRDAVVFEDAHHATVTAKKGGYKVVAVEEKTELAFLDIIKDNCDIYVESMMDLIKRENL